MKRVAFGGKIKYIYGVGLLIRGDVVAKPGREGVRIAKLKISACSIAWGVIMLGSSPVVLAVVVQRIGKVGSFSLSINVRCCGVQRCMWRGVRLGIGRSA